MKTECYHFFHKSCLRKSVDYFISIAREKKEERAAKSINLSSCLTEEEIMEESVCTFCKTKLGIEDIEEMRSVDHDSQLQTSKDTDVFNTSFVLPKEIVEIREKMNRLYIEQMQKGGIIDIHQNERRFYVDSNTFLVGFL